MAGALSTNPYHYSFQLCAKNGTDYQNETNKTQFSKNRFSSYTYDYSAAETTNEYHCDRCDRSLHNEKQYKDHLAEHVVCGLDGCQFIAHPKVVSLHVRMQHDTGLYNKLKSLQNPSGTSNWLEERKRKYPTRLNIEFKAKLKTQKEIRGERILPNTDRFNKNFQYNRQNPRAFEKKRRKPQRKRKSNVCSTNKYKVEVIEDENGSIQHFEGTRGLYKKDEIDVAPTENIIHISDDDYEDEPPNALSTCVNQPINKSLGLLMASYGSDDSEPEVEENKAKPIVLGPAILNAEYDSDGPPEEVKTHKCNAPLTIESRNVPVKRQAASSGNRRGKRSRTSYSNTNSKRTNFIERPRFTPRPRKPTLLEKLLEKEIIHERNVLLQCVRHIVNKNFFDPVDQE